MQLAERRDPGATASAVLAVVVHAALFVVLVFGIRWRTQQPAPVMAELWQPIPAVAPPPPPPPKPAPVVEPPKPAPTPPEPKVEKAPEPKPDIALEQEKKRREELEKKRLEDAARAKAEQERKAKEEAEKREAEKRQAEKREADERRRQQEEDRKRMQDQLNRELAQASPKPGAPIIGPATPGDPLARQQWGDRIRARIRPNIVVPPELTGNPEAVFDVELLPSGDVRSVKLKRSSGSRAYDEAVERAILKSSPLPLPEKRETFSARLELVFRPRD